MLHALELENFKAFGKRARIPFAPITLIFGENSAGKSTILQALNLLKQTRESREAGALLLPRDENGIVDLGSFQEMIFDHDLKRTLSIRVETKVDRQLAVEFSFKRPSLEEEVLLDQIEVYYDEPSKCIAKFQPSEATVESEVFWEGTSFLYNPFFRDPRGFPPSKISAIKYVWLTDEVEYWEPEFEWCKENKKDVVSWFEEEKLELEEFFRYQMNAEDGNEQKRSEEELREFHRRIQRELEFLDVDIKFFSLDFDLESYISNRRKEEMNTLLGVQGFLPVGVVSRERLTRVGTLLRRRADDITFDVSGIAIAAGGALEGTLESLFPMGPFRRGPERWYIFTGTSPQDVGYRGDLLPDLLFRRPKLVEDTNGWLKRLDVGYELKVKPVGTDSGDLFEVRLIDTRRKGKKNIDVALPDVGFGISQLLPFIVQSLVSEKQIISIEQPEVHVHPKLQADLGDLLAEAIKEPRQNQFIVETHSEHLVLRLQRRVYEKKIKPEDVSIIYVSRGPEGAKLQRLHLDEEGDFVDEWPDGFFPERLRELR